MRDKGRSQASESRHGQLAELARGQHGVVSIRQLTGPLGYSRSAVARAADAGRLHRLYRGVYAVGHTRISRYGECLAAVLACGPLALLSHQSAAWLWGISTGSPVPFAVTAPTSRKLRPPIRLHQARSLASEDRALLEGIPVTALPRTLLDLAAVIRFERLQRVLERSEELRLFDLGPVEDLLDRTVGHHGHGRLRKALALYRPAPFTRSQLERRFLAAVLAAGLPQPRTNFVEAGFELDLFWPEERFAVELDSYATHGGHGAFERDRLRQEDLKLAGVEITRATDVRFADDPEGVIARVGRLLALRRG
jgi:hypothetical protein